MKLRSIIAATTLAATAATTPAMAQSVGNYVGAGALLNQQGIDGNGYSANRTVMGATLQGRYAVTTFDNQNAVSVRPYVNLVGTPAGQIGAAGGAMVTYDWSVVRTSTGASRANVYAGAGYQVPFTNGTDANFQSAIGDRGQVAFVTGFETRMTDSLVGFVDLKFPTTNVAANDGTYSPVLTVGAGIRF